MNPVVLAQCSSGVSSWVDLDCQVHTRRRRSNSCQMACEIGAQLTRPIYNVLSLSQLHCSVVFSQLAMEHPHILLLGALPV